MALNVTLVRHAETRLNLERVLQGSIDEPLSESGTIQARRLGFQFQQKDEKFSQVFSSELSRAIATTQWICCQARYPPNQIHLDSRLRERCYGMSEGAPIASFKENAAKFGYGNGIHYLYTPPGGESYAQLTDRVVDFFRYLCALADADEGKESPENILVVSHGSLITALMRYLHNEPKLLLEDFDPEIGLVTPGNTGVTRFSISPHTDEGNSKRLLRFTTINNLEHLNI